MRRSEREAKACYLGCGNERAPNNPYRLCYTCLDRLYKISGDARKAKERRRTERTMEDEKVIPADPALASLYGEPVQE